MYSELLKLGVNCHGQLQGLIVEGEITGYFNDAVTIVVVTEQ
jgi:hypothetical protein